MNSPAGVLCDVSSTCFGGRSGRLRSFGPWQTVWKRHAPFSRDGTWDGVLTRLLAEADAAGELDWAVSVDSTCSPRRWRN